MNLGVVYVAEVSPKINFTAGKISPFVTLSAGGGVALNIFAEDEGDGQTFGFGTYSVGAGVDFHLGKKTTLYTAVKGRGGFSREGILPLIFPEFGIGLQWVF